MANPPGKKQDIAASAVPRETKKKKGGKTALKRRAPAPMVLEQRFMFDAAAIDTAADVMERPLADAKPVPTLPDTLSSVNMLLDAADATSAAAAALAESADKVSTDRDVAHAGADSTATVDPIAELDKLIAERPEIAPQLEAHKEIVFVDAGVADYQDIIGSLRPGIGVVLLDPARDAWSQMTEALKAAGNVSGVHIISHGFEGGLIFNGVAVTDAALAAQSAELALWKQYLTQDADILLYGCEISAGSEGREFISTWAELTQADVAASSDSTGAADRGGNWILEDSIGQVETKTFAFDDYSQLLVVTYSTTTPAAGTVLTGTGTLTGNVSWQWFRNSSNATGGTVVASGAGASG
ncbi:DUF4347 domain-containing protein, partial [Lacisediminimonas sp.]|uniref:DUF4347 domain-containing protein n=1 Tax=Lacisediminimonas sp. TaxID=3060582 RepID=UPI00271B835A